MTNENMSNMSPQQNASKEQKATLDNPLLALEEKISKAEVKFQKASDNLKRLNAMKEELITAQKADLIKELFNSNKINKDILTDSQKRILGL